MGLSAPGSQVHRLESEGKMAAKRIRSRSVANRARIHVRQANLQIP